MKTRSKLVGALVLASSLTLLTLRVLHSQSKSQTAGPEMKRRVIFSSSKASIDSLLMTPQEREIELGIPARGASKTGNEPQKHEGLRQLWPIPVLQNIPTAPPQKP